MAFDSLASVLSRLTGLNVRILNDAGDLVDAAEGVHVPARWQIGGGDRIDDELPATSSVALRVDATGLSTLQTSLDDKRTIVVGPFVEADAAVRAPQSLAVSEQRAWTQFLRSLPHKEPSDVDAIARLLAVAETLVATEVDRGHRERTPMVAPLAESEAERDAIEARYAAEHALRDAIARGDRAALVSLQRMAAGFDAFADRLPHDPLRLRQNLLVVLNSIGRLAAEKGGVLPVELHALSEKHAIEIERCSTTREAESLASTILEEYCDAVRMHSLTSLSLPVRRAATHIMQHLNEQLPLADLAALSSSNPTYLSRRFHAETGVTITEFTQAKRIAAACWLLENDTTPVTEIAYRVGFEDPNYFSRVFRARMGITARTYRRDNQGHRLADMPMPSG